MHYRVEQRPETVQKERRKKTRVQVDVEGEIFLGDKTFPALMLNVSLGGCLIETSARPRLREIVALHIRLGMTMKEIKLKVVWQSYGDGLGKIGTQFYGITENEINTIVARILGASPRSLEHGEKDDG